MAETEGVIKYRLDFHPGQPPEAAAVAELDAWRTLLHRLRLVGQCAERYDGYGYGNVSIRFGGGFLISGTQTAAPEVLGPESYSVVTACDPARNHVVATGAVRPSSESLTHAAVYALHPAIGAVLHVHCPEIWHAESLRLPSTAADVPYGTPAMAEAVANLYCTTALPTRRIFAMRGHTDGVVAFGRTPAHAGAVLMASWAGALAGFSG